MYLFTELNYLFVVELLSNASDSRNALSASGLDFWNVH